MGKPSLVRTFSNPNLPDMPDFLSVCVDAAQRGGRVLLDWQDRFKPREKAPKDLVTEADLAAQDVIQQSIRKAFPDHDFLGEEQAAERKVQGLAPIPPRRSEYRWIVDPLDGTMNYVHRLPGFAVSIGLQQGDDVILGVILDPIAGDCFVAVRGEGVKLNGKSIQTSGCERADQALIAVSFSPNVPRNSIEIARFVEGLIACQSVRRMGSAALNLAYVAAGRLDAYWATSVCIWDVAAGLLMVEVAGGAVIGIDGSPVVLERPEFVASASEPLQGHMLEILRRAAEPRAAS
jgi:myo-inositol-1(or 4)-monophosphatase